MELSKEQLDKAEGMTLDELRKAALEEGITPPPEPKEEIDNSAEGETAEAEGEEEEEVHIFRKEILNADGTTDIYEANSLEDLVDKIAEGKRQAVEQMKRVQEEKRQLAAKVQQVNEDDNYIFKKQFEKDPKGAFKQIVYETLTEQQKNLQAAQDAQSRFVNLHPDYIPNSRNGARLVAWLQAHGHNDMTYEGLEKAYQDLSSGGLLELKAEGAEAATDSKAEVAARTEPAKAEVTQRPSPKRSSNIRTTARTTTTVASSVMPSEDEAYAMPLDKLRELANAQLAKANG